MAKGYSARGGFGGSQGQMMRQQQMQQKIMQMQQQMAKAQEDVETVAADICQVLDLALVDFSAMREREGQKLREDILSRAGTIGRLTSFVEEQSPKTVSEYRARLEAKMRDVLQNTQIDDRLAGREAGGVQHPHGGRHFCR